MTTTEQRDSVQEELREGRRLWMEVPSDIRNLIEVQNSHRNPKQRVTIRMQLGKEYGRMSSAQQRKICSSIRDANDSRSTLHSKLDFGPIKVGMWAFQIANPLTPVLRPLRDQITKLVKLPATGAIREIQDYQSYAPTWKAMASQSWGLLVSSAMVALGSILVALADDPFELSEIADDIDRVTGFDLTDETDNALHELLAKSPDDPIWTSW